MSHLMDVLTDARGHPGRARHPLRDQRQRGDGGGDARGVDQLPACAARSPSSPRSAPTSPPMRSSNLASAGVTGGALVIARRGLRRGLVDHAGAQPRVRDEVADVAARPAPEPAVDRRHGEDGLRALRGLQDAGDARAAHPRLPRARPVRGEDEPARRLHSFARRWRPASTSAASALPPTTYAQESDKIEVRWPAAVHFIEEHELNEFFAGDMQRHRHRRPGRPVQRGAALAPAARPRRRVRQVAGADLRHERRLPGDRKRGQRVRGRQARGAGRRGRAAQLHRADAGDGAAPRRLCGRAAWQGPAAARRRVHARRRPRRAARVPRALRPALGGGSPGRGRRDRAGGARRPRARAAAGLLHRLPRAADLQRDQAGRARARRAPHERRHRLPPVLDPAAVPPRQHDDGLRARHRRRVGVQRAGHARRGRGAARQARDQRHGRRRLLAQRADQRHRQRGLQPQRQPDHRRRQQLHVGDRRPGRCSRRTPPASRAAPATRSSAPCAASASSG